MCYWIIEKIELNYSTQQFESKNYKILSKAICSEMSEKIATANEV